MKSHPTDDDLRALLERVRDGLERLGSPTRLLSAIAWPPEVEAEFFARGARALPEVRYEVDRDGSNARVAALDALERSIEGAHPVAEWLRATVRSYADGNRLLLAAGTTEFHRLSRELYGSARTRFLGDALRNLDLADHLLERVAVHGWDEARDPDPEALSDEAFAALLEEKIASRTPTLPVTVERSDECAAKVIAGMSRVRVRRGATFLPWEADSLFVHEVETHALTAQNGAAQTLAPFLRGGGPRTTRTQEGLAVFAELYARRLSIERLARLATRVKLVDMAEQGASFLDLYRHLVASGSEPREAFLDAQRVCRGGRVEGSAPFTKDACYLAGLVHVVSFLAVVVRGGLRDEAEMLVAGRIALDDVAALVELRHRGLLTRPAFRPTWLREWRQLLPFCAFVSFFNGLGLAPVEDHYRAVLDLARAQRPPTNMQPEPPAGRGAPSDADDE